MENICEFCQRTFSNKHNLKAHQRSARYCLKLRKIDGPRFQCNDCEKDFSSKHNLKIHIKSCQILDFKQKFTSLERQVISYQDTIKGLERDLEIRTTTHQDTIKGLERELEIRITTHQDITNGLENELETQKEKNKDLQNKLQEALLKAIEKPTTNINQRIMNLQPISAEYFRECAKGYTIEHVKDPDGLYKYLYGTCDGRLITTDVSRRIVKYPGEDGEIITDPNMMKLLKAALEAIEGLNKELTTKCLNDIRDYCDQNPMNFPPTDLLQFEEDRANEVLLKKWIIKNVCDDNPQSDETKTLVKQLCARFA